MPEQALRNELVRVKPNIRLLPHPGLWLDKFLPQQFAQGEKGGEDDWGQKACWKTPSPCTAPTACRSFQAAR